MKHWDEAQWERALRAEADHVRPAAPAAIKDHVLDAVASLPQRRAQTAPRPLRWIAAAAAAVLLAAVFGPSLRESAAPERVGPQLAGPEPHVATDASVEGSVVLAYAFGPGAPWVVPTEAFDEVVDAPAHVERHVEDPLLEEVRSFASDTDTLIDRFLGGLPGPLERCLPFGRSGD